MGNGKYSEEFKTLREINDKDSTVNRALSSGKGNAAHFAAYGVAFLAIGILSLIYAQTMSNVFTDPIMKAMSVLAAFAVGSSAYIFLIFRDKLLKSRDQFIAAGAFVTIEIVLLTLGALFSFGNAFGWTFDNTWYWIERIAIVITLPTVLAEWIVVKALDPDSMAARSQVHTDSEVKKHREKARKAAMLSDAHMTIVREHAMAQVIAEQLESLPPAQRPYFLRLIRKNNSADLKNINEVLDDLEKDYTAIPGHSASIEGMPPISLGVPTNVEQSVPVPSGNGMRPKA